MILRLIVRRLLFLAAGHLVGVHHRVLHPADVGDQPIRERFAELARTGGFSPADLEKIIASYTEQFGLDQPLVRAILGLPGQIVRFDFGYSLNRYPIDGDRADHAGDPLDTVAAAGHHNPGLHHRQPAGRLVGLAPRAALGARVATPFVLLTGVPPVIMGVLLLFFLGFRLKLLPLGGAYSIGIVPDWVDWPSGLT